MFYKYQISRTSSAPHTRHLEQYGFVLEILEIAISILGEYH